MPTSLSSEIIVNTTTAGDQVPAGVAALTGGRTVVTWIDQGPETDVVRLRLYGPGGDAASAEITLGPAAQADVAALSGGGFVVVWTTGPDAPATVHSQVFDPSGQALGAARELAAYSIAGTPTLGLRLLGLEVTGLSDGGYVAGWSVQRADSMGFQSLSSRMIVADAQGQVERDVPIAVESSNKQLVQYDPDISFVDMGDGRFLATWRDAPTLGPGLNDLGAQWAQVYDLSGQPLAAAVQLDPSMPADGGPVINPVVGLDLAHTEGGYVAFAWGTGDSVWVSFYPDDRLGLGNATNRTQPVRAGDAAPGQEPQVVELPDGRVLVAWTGAAGDVMGRLFTPEGAAVGAAFVLGDTPGGAEDLLSVDIRADGALVAVWREADASGTGVTLQVIWPDGGGIVGSEGADGMVGTGAADLLVGRAGDDWLLGLGGDDTLSGGMGADKFILTVGGGADRIVDFTHGTDTLLLFDATGNIAPGAGGLLVLDARTGALSWDADSDAGPIAARAIGVLPGATSLARGDFAAGFQPSGLRTLNADGGRTDTAFDWSGQAWDTSAATYTASGELKRYEVHNDNGAWSFRENDVDNATPAWSSVVAEYDTAGRLFAYSVYGDDGARTLWLFDTAGVQPWSRVIEGYDPLGRLSVQAAALDDGGAWERHIDTYDTQPWAYYIDNYANGALLNHTYYNADGTVFLG
ncbi:calcium-binding protein [Phenylobacterium sp.]|uniref:calcium-binding protein n=1 Tax=Phenylobacterium sp. TaxID=1871053 RepID=UPI002FDFF18B